MYITFGKVQMFNSGVENVTLGVLLTNEISSDVYFTNKQISIHTVNANLPSRLFNEVVRRLGYNRSFLRFSRR